MIKLIQEPNLNLTKNDKGWSFTLIVCWKQL
jgi:hypothetical protein